MTGQQFLEGILEVLREIKAILETKEQKETGNTKEKRGGKDQGDSSLLVASSALGTCRKNLKHGGN